MISVSVLVLTMCAGSALSQFEEYKSVPVYVKPSDICSDKTSKPQIYLQPEPLYIQKLGDKVKIPCAAHGMPTPLVYWIKGKKDLTDNEKRLRVTGQGSALLYFDKLEEEDVDVYTCVVEDCCRGTVQKFETEIRVRVNHGCTKNMKPNSFWVVVWEYTNWESARQFCEDKGMQLAAPHSAEENELLHSEIQRTMGKDPNGKKFAHHNMVWIGYTDGVVEGGFTDINTGDAMSYRNWMPKQPDNWHKYDKEGQDAVAMDRITGKWDDSFGFWKRPFACWCPPKFRRKTKGRKEE